MMTWIGQEFEPDVSSATASTGLAVLEVPQKWRRLRSAGRADKNGSLEPCSALEMVPLLTLDPLDEAVRWEGNAWLDAAQAIAYFAPIAASAPRSGPSQVLPAAMVPTTAGVSFRKVVRHESGSGWDPAPALALKITPISGPYLRAEELHAISPSF